MVNLQTYDEQSINDAFYDTITYFKTVHAIDAERMSSQIQWAKKIIDSYVQGYETVIVSAPTGFGKSLLAFFLAKFFDILLSKYTEDDNKGMASYVLTSNKFLQAQYQRDLDTFAFNNWSAMLKGQSNYGCDTDESLTFASRPCSDAGLGDLESGKSKWACGRTCKYITSRRKAIESNLSIFNYAYWLTAMQLTKTLPNYPFKQRALTVFDECHVLGNIVQDMFSVDFNINSYIRRYISSMSILAGRLVFHSSVSYSDMQHIVSIYDSMMKSSNDLLYVKELLSKLIDALTEQRNAYNVYVLDLIKQLPRKDDGAPITTKEEQVMIQFSGLLLNKINQLMQLKDVYEELGHETIVLSFDENNTKKIAPIEQFGEVCNWSMKLRCTNESALVKMFALTNCNYSLFMSATIGNIKDYAEQTGITNYVGFDVPQVFDYEKSPIFYVQPMIAMNHKNKDMNMSQLIQRIVMCVEKHPHERGLVHTGNFEIMRHLEQLNHPRILTYSNSAEKEDILRLLSKSDDAVVCGPSLIEGVDLKDDLCRFMIFAKVPYMSLADALVKRKIQVYKNWYNWTTLSSVLQGLGRPIRNDKDWCVTYLLDSSFADFFKRYSPPSWVSNRFKDTHYTNIGQIYDPVAEGEAEFERMLGL